MANGVLFLFLQFLTSINANWTTTAAKLALEIGEKYHCACFHVFYTDYQDVLEKRGNDKIIRALMSGLKNSSDSEGGLRFQSVNGYSFVKYAEHLQKISNGRIFQTCYKPLNIFLATDKNRLQFSWLSQNYKICRAVWLVLGDFDEEEYFRTTRLNLDTDLLTAKPTLNGYQISKIFRISPSKRMTIIPIGIWTEFGLNISDTSFYKHRSDLSGIIFRIGAIDNWPISTFGENSNDKQIELDGFFPRVWKELEECMNFTSIAYRSIDNHTGALINNRWNGLVAMLLRHEIDAIVSELNINSERTAIMDFPHPLIRTHYQIYYELPGYNLSWTAVLEPFDFWLWFALLAWLIIGTISLRTIYKFSNENLTEIYVQPSNSFFFILQSLCQQGYWQTPKSLACRLVFLLAYVMSAVIIPSYAGSLISSLTAQTPYRPFDTLTEMLGYKDEYKLIIQPNTAEYTFFSEAKDRVFQEVFKNLVVSNDDVEYFRSVDKIETKICNNKIALFAVVSSFRPRLAHLTKCRIIPFSKPISIVYQGIGLRKSDPYTGLIHYHLGRMQTAGIISRIYKSTWPIIVSKHEPAFQQVTSNQVFQIFVCWAAGIVLSVVILIAEILVKKRHR